MYYQPGIEHIAFSRCCSLRYLSVTGCSSSLSGLLCLYGVIGRRLVVRCCCWQWRHCSRVTNILQKLRCICARSDYTHVTRFWRETFVSSSVF